MRKNRIGLRTQINKRAQMEKERQLGPRGPRETKEERARRLYDAETERLLKGKPHDG